MKKNVLLTIAALITALSAMATQHLPDKDRNPVSGDVAYNATDVINIHITGTADNQYDRLELSSGTLFPSGATLNVFPCYQPTPGDRFVVFKAPTIDGKFSSPPLIDAGGNFFVLSYERENNSDLVVLTAVTKLFGLYINTSDSPLVKPDYNYTLNVVAKPEAGGSVNVNPTQATYKVCDEIDIQATANTGFRFVEWTQIGGAIIANTAFPTTNAQMPASDVTITANFCKFPDAPVANDATGITTNTFTANWEEVPDINNYELQVALNSNFSPTLKTFNVSAGTLSQTVVVECSATYYYRIKATDDCGPSDYSVTKSVTLDNVPITFTYRGEQVTYGTIRRGGLCWMDRNLGASRVPTSRTDPQGYGDLFQWGRGDDGHQTRTSNTTSTLSNTNDPYHGNFITVSSSPNDWRSPQNNALWQGEAGINNPCPPGWRVPTEAELIAERNSWNSYDRDGAYDSTLKWPSGGRRLHGDGTLDRENSIGFVWSSTVANDHRARRLRMQSSSASTGSHERASGMSVRCVKDN